ncbi:hypothetical protein GCM10027345_21360 [Hymenobacter daeguensis]
MQLGQGQNGAHAVVQLAGNALALVFLGHQRGGQGLLLGGFLEVGYFLLLPQLHPLVAYHKPHQPKHKQEQCRSEE